MDINQKLPSVEHMRQAARRRVPRFGLDYLEGGIGQGRCLQHNRESLDRIQLEPRYLVSNAEQPDCSCTFLENHFDWPFGVAPIGLSGLVWPKAPEYLAAAARQHNIPFTLSGFSTSSIQDIAPLAGPNGWYQHYMCTDDSINEILINRAQDCGYKTLVITVDIPTMTRRAHDIRNGLSVPPRFNLGTVLELLKSPQWSWETWQAGIPEFKNLVEFMPDRNDLGSTAIYLQQLIEGHVSPERLKWVRDHWPHHLIVKGILCPDDAIASRNLGADALVVSNHGGRQLDAAPSTIEVIGQIRDAVGKNFPLVADGGVRTGVDIARYLACGADFVLAGRPFMYAVAAAGEPGASHVMDVLAQEFRSTLGQLGCDSVASLSRFLKQS